MLRETLSTAVAGHFSLATVQTHTDTIDKFGRMQMPVPVVRLSLPPDCLDHWLERALSCPNRLRNNDINNTNTLVFAIALPRMAILCVSLAARQFPGRPYSSTQVREWNGPK